MSEELQKPKKNKGGRPCEYTPEIGKEICEAISVSNTSVKRLCEAHPGWPDFTTVFSWINKVPEFAKQYVRAKQNQASFLTDEMLEIAETNKEDHQVARLKIDTRKWLACKLVPKVFGDRVSIDSDRDENIALKEEIKVLRAKLEQESKRDY